MTQRRPYRTLSSAEKFGRRLPLPDRYVTPQSIARRIGELTALAIRHDRDIQSLTNCVSALSGASHETLDLVDRVVELLRTRMT